MRGETVVAEPDTVDEAEAGGGVPARGRAVVLVALAVWVLAAGTVSWLLVREPAVVPTPSLAVGPWELAPLVDQRLEGGSGGGRVEHGRWNLQADVGDEGLLRLEVVHEEVGLPDLVPARSRPELTLEQRQAFDLATLEGEEGTARWRTEVGLDAPTRVPRGEIVADERVACLRVVVSADRAGPIDQAALAALLTTVRERLEDSIEHQGTCEGTGRG